MIWMILFSQTPESKLKSDLMRTILTFILFGILCTTTGLMAQNDIKKFIHKELSGGPEIIRNDIPEIFQDKFPGFPKDNTNGSIPDDIANSDALKSFYDGPGIKKSTNEDFGNTPDWIWVKQFGGSATDAGQAVTSDAMGNIYVAAYFSGTTIIGNDTLESTGNADMLLMKFSQTCYPLWVQHVSAPEGKSVIPESILLDNSGNLIITGIFNCSTLNIEGTVLNQTGSQDIFIAKFSASGNLTWAKSYGESERLFGGSKVKTDAGNNYYVICSEGYIYSKMVKYDVFGQLKKNLTQPDAKINDLEVYNMNLYLTGTIEGNIGGGNKVHLLFISKNDLEGNTTWLTYANALYSYGSSEALDISVGNDESIFLLGTLNMYAIWDNDTLLDLQFLPFISKINPDDGQINWTKTLKINRNSNKPYMQLFLDAINNIYMVGYSSDTVLYDGVSVDPGNFVIKCNSDGTGLWSETLDFMPISVTCGSDKMIATGTDPYGNILVSRYNSSAVREYSTNIKSNSGTGLISGLETDSEANLYSYGSLTGSGEIFGRTYQNFRGCFLSKQNSKGDLIWIEFIKGGSAITMTQGNTLVFNKDYNGLYFVGDIIDTLKIGNEVILPADATQFLTKYNSEGVFEWVKPITGFDFQCSISTDQLGNVIFSGGYAGNVTIGDISFTGERGRNAYIAKFDPDGVLKWAKQDSSSNVIYNLIASTDKNNMIYFTGEFYPGKINFSGTIINTEGDSEGDILFAKMDPNGNPLWIKTFGNGTGYNRYDVWPTRLVTNPDGYSYMSGWHGDSVYFDNFLLAKPLVPKKYTFNFFITKIDPSGNVVWINSIFEEKWDYDYNEMELDESGSCYFMARFQDTLMFGNDLTFPNTGQRDLFIAKYYSNGDLAWVKSIETTTGMNWIQGLAVYDSLSLYTGGYFINQATFDPVTITASAQHGFIALLSQDRLNCMEITSSSSDYVCSGRNDGYIDITVNEGTPPYSYEWSNGAVSEDIEDLTSGEYNVAVTDNRLCIARTTVVIDSVMTYQGSELCMVTVNNNNKIVLVWEKDYDKYIQSYRLYREKTKDNYIQIAEVPFENLSIYADQTSTPDELSHFYKIKAVDVCGDSSEFSPYHKSIHLWTAVGVSGEVTLTWDEYEGFYYGEYKIYRGASLDALQEIRTISSSSKSWTDPAPPSGQVFYRVVVTKPESCFPTSNKAEEYGSAVSNYDEETIGVIEPASDQTITIFPNPFNDKTRIIFSNPDNSSWELVITDLAGKVVRSESHITTSEFELERGNLPAGIYLIELHGERIYRGKLVVQ
jgi:hypothetical protein